MTKLSRQERLAEALRANLKRRKAQRRSRGQDGQDKAKRQDDAGRH